MRWLRMGWGLVREAFGDWSEDKAPRLGAALAYYTVFSIAPLLLIVIAIAGMVFGPEAARGQIVAQLETLIGPDAARAVQEMLANAQRPSAGIVATVVGVVTLLLGASGVFGQLQDALNTVWEVEPKPGRGIMGIVRDRFLSLTMVLGTGFLLLVSLVLSAVVASAGEVLRGLGPGLEAVGHVVELVISFGVVTLLFAGIFKYLPDVQIAWRDVWIGAVVTAFLFVVGKVAIGLYLGHASIASAYGAAGSLVVLLVWVYYSAQILLFGAELTQVYANRSGKRVRPAENAVRITEKDRAEQGIPRSA
ncbi:MAG TPA: YihY/virulence factor BrkB family protein [Candidatus Binatia bacterium]|nr:YihY/virulence factor BrkB family protein [Candidatus Binatia bacterium]